MKEINYVILIKSLRNNLHSFLYITAQSPAIKNNIVRSFLLPIFIKSLRIKGPLAYWMESTYDFHNSIVQ